MSGQGRPVGIIDIGSNSIRLVVYHGQTRTPVPLFNEKAVCALGQGLGASGRLSPPGVEMAFAAVGRFVAIARAMRVARLDVLATAAAREAQDGKEFVAELERRFGIEVTVLSGGREARLAALGVLCGTPGADGIVADLGGGSVDLARIADGRVGDHATLPLGMLRLSETSDNERAKAAAIIDRHLAQIPWLDQAQGRAVYAVGGAWRAVARVCIAQTAHPLLVLDNYTLERREAERLIDLISRQSRKSLEKMPGVARKRLPTLPLAALLLEKILEAARPAHLVFSIFGMREGQFYRQLPDEVRRQDPLLSECTRLVRLAGREPAQALEALEWMDPLFPGETAAQRRMRHAASLLSLSFWSEHPDYRAEQAFLRVLRLPFMGLGHRDRAALALAVHGRYYGDEDQPYVWRARALLDDERVRRVRIIAMALALAHSASGGAPGILPRTRLSLTEGELLLEVPQGDPLFQPDFLDRHLDRLAKALGRAARFVGR